MSRGVKTNDLSNFFCYKFCIFISDLNQLFQWQRIALIGMDFEFPNEQNLYEDFAHVYFYTYFFTEMCVTQNVYILFEYIAFRYIVLSIWRNI